jgi:hypothetical protein
MAFDPNTTLDYLLAVNQITPPVSFLSDRYFPTNDATDIFSSEKVLAEYKRGNKKIAPVVAPRVGGVTVLRSGSKLKEYDPPTVAPKRTTTLDDVIRRGFGESILPTLTPEERESQLALNDAAEMIEFHVRRREQIAAELLQNNGYVLKQIGDKDNLYEDFEILFYDGTDNPAVYTIDTPWSDEDADILADLAGMIYQQTSRGLAASELIVSGDVADLILNNNKIYEKLLIPDGKLNIGKIDPKELPNGASLIAVLNVRGRNIEVLSYDESYENDEGVDTPFIAPGTAILTAPAIGKTLYGAVSQYENKQLHTYAAKYVPKTIVDEDKNVKEVTITSKPLLLPVNESPFVTANVIE